MNILASKNRQSGMTLIEIMVALVISLFLLAGLLQMFIATRQSAKVQENLSRVQENGRFGIEYINRIIRQAGYRSGTSILNGFSFKEKFKTNQADGSDNDGYNDSDTITARFEGENIDQGEVRNCLNTKIVSTVALPVISIDTLSVNNSNNLQCQAITPAGGSAETQPILENVENMQILYGRKINNNVAYVSASDIGNNDWDDVFSVRVSLVLRTAEDRLVDAPQPYIVNGETITPTDRRLYRVFTTTVALRN